MTSDDFLGKTGIFAVEKNNSEFRLLYLISPIMLK